MLVALQTAMIFALAGRGAPALALDLMEELRPAVDAVVLALLNLRQLDPADLREPDPEELGERAELAEGACFLGPTARAVLLRAWERRLEDRLTHPTQGGRWALLRRTLDPRRDSVRVYALCRACAGLVRVHGVAPELPDPDAPLIVGE